MPAGDEQPDQGPRDRVAHQPRLMRKEADHERRLGESEPEIGAERAEVAAHRDSGPPRDHGSDDWDQGRQYDRREHEDSPNRRCLERQASIPPASARTAAGADSVRRRLSSIFQRPIAGMAPRFRSSRDGAATEDPGQQLPIAARPAMMPQSRDVVAGGEFLDHLDVGGETGAREDALEQIVAEQRGVRNPAGERGLEGIDIVDALAGIGAFAEQILIDVGDGGGIRVDAADAGEDALEQRALAADRQ